MIVFNELGINLNTEKLIVDVSVKENTYYSNYYISNIYIDTQDTYKDGGFSSKAKKITPIESLVYIPKIKENIYLLDFPITSIDQYIIDLDNLSSHIIKIEDSLGNKYTLDHHPHPGIKYNKFTYTNGGLVLVRDSDNINDLLPYYDITKHCRLEIDNETLGTDVSNTMYFVYIETVDTSSKDTNTNLGITLNTSTIYNNMMMYIKDISKECGIPKEYIDYFLQFEAFRLSIRTGHNMQAINYFNKFFKKPLEAYSRINTCYG